MTSCSDRQAGPPRRTDLPRCQQPAVFAPPDADGWSWTPSDDVYQLALIALSALAGEVVVTYEVCGRLLKSVEASDAMKGWIREALAARGDRFVDAGEALAGLGDEPIKPAPPPRSLRCQHVVFTGNLKSTRSVAQGRANAVGAVVQGRVNGATSVIVAGQPNPLQIGQQHGTKLCDAHRRIRGASASRSSTGDGSTDSSGD